MRPKTPLHYLNVRKLKKMTLIRVISIEIMRTTKYLSNLQMHGLASLKAKTPVSKVIKMAMIMQLHERLSIPKPRSVILLKHPIMTPIGTSKSSRKQRSQDLS